MTKPSALKREYETVRELKRKYSAARKLFFRDYLKAAKKVSRIPEKFAVDRMARLRRKVETIGLATVFTAGIIASVAFPVAGAVLVGLSAVGLSVNVRDALRARSNRRELIRFTAEKQFSEDFHKGLLGTRYPPKPAKSLRLVFGAKKDRAIDAANGVTNNKKNAPAPKQEP